jgi:hypothetical protein
MGMLAGSLLTVSVRWQKRFPPPSASLPPFPLYVFVLSRVHALSACMGFFVHVWLMRLFQARAERGTRQVQSRTVNQNRMSILFRKVTAVQLQDLRVFVTLRDNHAAYNTYAWFCNLFLSCSVRQTGTENVFVSWQ